MTFTLTLAGPNYPPLRDVQKTLIVAVLWHNRGHLRRSARELGISRWTLSRYMVRYELKRETFIYETPPHEFRTEPNGGLLPEHS